MYIIDEQSLKYFILLIIAFLILISIIICLIAINRTSVKELNKENKLLRQQLKEIRTYDKKCTQQYDMLNNKINILQKQVDLLKKGE